jgi:hypothetical protein
MFDPPPPVCFCRLPPPPSDWLLADDVNVAGVLVAAVVGGAENLLD